MPRNFDPRIRHRMVDDARAFAGSLRSELGGYRGEFWPGEVQAIKIIIRDLESLADRIGSNDRAEAKKIVKSTTAV